MLLLLNKLNVWLKRLIPGRPRARLPPLRPLSGMARAGGAAELRAAHTSAIAARSGAGGHPEPWAAELVAENNKPLVVAAAAPVVTGWGAPLRSAGRAGPPSKKRLVEACTQKLIVIRLISY